MNPPNIIKSIINIKLTDKILPRCFYNFLFNNLFACFSNPTSPTSSLIFQKLILKLQNLQEYLKTFSFLFKNAPHLGHLSSFKFNQFISRITSPLTYTSAPLKGISLAYGETSRDKEKLYKKQNVFSHFLLSIFCKNSHSPLWISNVQVPRLLQTQNRQSVKSEAMGLTRVAPSQRFLPTTNYRRPIEGLWFRLPSLSVPRINQRGVLHPYCELCNPSSLVAIGLSRSITNGRIMSS